MENKRNTEQKQIIYNRLVEAGHPTASELYESIHKTNPKISRATVFRVLSQFAAEGTIRKLEFLGSDTRFDATNYPHAHCHCVQCGKVVDVMQENLNGILSEKQVAGFRIYSTEIEFSGLCAECAEKLN